MKYMTILFCLFISSCMFVPLYSIPDDDAKWIDKTTGEDAPVEMLEKCSKYASFSIIGRNSFSDRIDAEYINHIGEVGAGIFVGEWFYQKFVKTNNADGSQSSKAKNEGK